MFIGTPSDSQILGIIIITPIITILLSILIEYALEENKIKNPLLNGLVLVSSVLTLFYVTLCWEPFFINKTLFPIVDINFNLQADSLSLFIIMIFAILFFVKIIYIIGFMKECETLGLFYALLFALFTSLQMIVLVRDFFSLFVAGVFLIISSYSLIIFDSKEDSFEAGFKYLIVSFLGLLFALFGLALFYGLAGTLSFTYFPSLEQNLLFYLAISLVFVGFGIIALIFPFNVWFPDVQRSTPVPMGSFLSSFSVLAGIYSIIRLIAIVLPEIFANTPYQESDWNRILILIGILTMIQGNAFALLQLVDLDKTGRNIKKILTFVSFNHIGYLIVGIGIGTINGLTSALLYAFNYGLVICLLFCLVDYIYFCTRSYSLDDYIGLSRQDLFLPIALITGLLSVTGFWSKMLLLSSIIDDVSLYFGLLALIFIIVNISAELTVYFWLIWIIVIKKQNYEAVSFQSFEDRNFLDTLLMKISMGIVIVLIVVVSLYPYPLIEITKEIANVLMK